MIRFLFLEKEEDIYEDLCSFNSTEGQLEIQLMQPVEKRDYILKENTFSLDSRIFCVLYNMDFCLAGFFDFKNLL